MSNAPKANAEAPEAPGQLGIASSTPIEPAELVPTAADPPERAQRREPETEYLRRSAALLRVIGEITRAISER